KAGIRGLAEGGASVESERVRDDWDSARQHIFEAPLRLRHFETLILAGEERQRGMRYGVTSKLESPIARQACESLEIHLSKQLVWRLRALHLLAVKAARVPSENV